MAARLTPLAALSCLVLALPAAPADIRSLSVTQDGRRYEVISTTFVAAPPAAVFSVLADYDQYERLSSIIRDAYFVERDEAGNGRVFTRVRGCVAFFCKTIDRLERIEVDAVEHIYMEVIPTGSNLRSGDASWTFFAEGEGTRIEYRMRMVPDFWVPPLIGPYVVRKMLAKGAAGAADRVEHYAREESGLPALP